MVVNKVFENCARTLFHFALRALPGAFRARHGGEMRWTFEQRLLETADSHLLGRLALVVRELYGVLSAAGSARRAEHAVQFPDHLVQSSRRSLPFLEDLHFDLAFAFRQFGRSPLFTVVAVLVLALGIGVNAALLSYIDTETFRPPPGIDDAEGLVRITLVRERKHSVDGGREITDPPIHDEYLDFRQQQSVFEDVAATLRFDHAAVLDIDGDPRPSGVEFVGEGFFSTLRLHMAAGTGFGGTLARDVLPVAVISYRLWRANLGGSPDVVGRSIRIDRMPVTIVGVMPKGYDTLEGPDLWLPLSMRDLLSSQTARIATPNRAPLSEAVGLIGRLRDGVTLEEATAQSDAIARRIGGAHVPVDPLTGASLRPISGPGSGRGDDGSGLGFITIPILLIACTNVSILLLGRAVVRRREIAVRLALGSSRLRVVRQLVTEGILLALLAAVAGLLLLYGLRQFITTQFPEIQMDLAPSGRSIAATLAVAVLTGVFFALVPAFHATRVSVSETLKSGAAGLDIRGTRLQRGFVVVQITLAMALVCMTGIFSQRIRATARAQGFHLGNRVLVAELVLEMAQYTSARADELIAAARERIAVIPGVASVSATDIFPVTSSSWDGVTVTLAPFDSLAPGERVRLGRVDPDYFRMMGIPLLRGRDIAPTDIPNGLPVAVIDEGLATALWPGENPVGKRIAFKRTPISRGRPVTTMYEVAVVGVAGSVRMPMENHRPAVYLARVQHPDSGNLMLLVQTRERSAAQLAPVVRQQLRLLDPDLPIHRAQTVKQYRDERYSFIFQLSFAGSMAAAFALALACVGVYAVIAFGVAQRKRDIGIRRSLGARDGQVVGLFFRDGMRLAMIGFLIGVPAALALMKATMSRVLDIDMLTPDAVATIILILLTVAALASWLPARRASAVDPLDALRQD